MTRRALITGGAGFIGSHVTDLFVANGYDVTILDDFSSGKDANLNPAATVVRESIASPAAARLVREGNFDVIAHLAAQIDVRKSVNDPAWDAAVNIGGSLNLLESVRHSSHQTRFIFSSSGGAQYGDFVALPTPEDAAKDFSQHGQAFAAVVEAVRGKMARTGAPEAEIDRCMARLETLRNAWIGIAETQTSGGDPFRYAVDQPVRRLLQDTQRQQATMAPERRLFIAARSMRDTEPVALLRIRTPTGQSF